MRSGSFSPYVGPGQALMDWRWPLLATSILRGLAFSGGPESSTPALQRRTRRSPGLYPGCPPESTARLNTPGGRSAAEYLGVLSLGDGSFGLDREHVALDVKVDVLGLDPGRSNSTMNSSRPPSVHRMTGWAGCGAEHLLGESVEAPGRVGTASTCYHFSLPYSWCVHLGRLPRSDTAAIDFL